MKRLSIRIGTVSDAAFEKGAGRLELMPCRFDSMTRSGIFLRSVSAPRQSVEPRRFCIHAGPPALRTLSALTRPCSVARIVESRCVAAAIVTGPPRKIPVIAGARTEDSVNSMRPFACSSGGRSRSKTIWLLTNT